MRVFADRSLDGLSEAMLSVGGYVLLAIATILALLAEGPDPGPSATILAVAIAAAVWLYVGYTRLPRPRADHQARLLGFFVGVVVLASVLMLLQPLFFIFMISGFFYAGALRPYPVTVAGIGVTSILVNTLLTGVPRTPTAWTYYLVIIVIQTAVISAGSIIAARVSEQNEQRRETVVRLEQALAENAGLHAQLLTQAREAGVLEERQRLAREIHDTIAQGLTGVITQLGAARQSHDRPDEQDRHLANAEQIARESLAEARRSVEGSLPGPLEAATLPDALRVLARDWSERAAVPAQVTITGDRIRLEREIEVTLLRTAQEALANVAKHARASRVNLTLSFMDDVVTLDVRDDGVGFDVDRPAPTAGGFGLHGMRQRVARVAGSLEVES
jgi:signal transduction histidine kinase